MKKRWIPLLLFFVLLAGCGSSSTSQTPDFNTFIREVNDARANTMAWSEDEINDLAAYTPDFSDQMDAFTQDEMDQLVTPHENPGTITLEQAKEDVDTFFKIIQTTYGGYEYFGGDEVFLPIRDKVKSDLEQETVLDAEVLETLLSKYLSPVIVDGHFGIGNTALINSHMQYMYYVPDLYFDDTTGLDMDYVKPTIGPDGAITYCFAALSHDGTDLPDSVLMNGRKTVLSWTKSRNLDIRQYTAYSKVNIDDVPVLLCRTLTLSHETENGLDELASSGAQYRDLPLFMVDLRGNGGGNSNYAEKWVEGFTGQYPRLKAIYMQKCSPLLLQFCKAGKGDYTYPTEFIDRVEQRLGSWNISKNDGLQLKNGSTVIVLMDKYTGSAGESFVWYLRTVDNVIFVGSNTKGGHICGDVCYYLYLPNSGLKIGFGTSLGFAETMENTDGIGIFPDLWVNPADAMDAVMRLIDHYGLNSEQTAASSAS